MLAAAASPVAAYAVRRRRTQQPSARRAVRVTAVAAPPPRVQSWTPESWRAKEARQMPTYDDPAALKGALDELKRSPPLIFAGEVRELRRSLAKVANGEAFLLQGGDCAEGFAEFNTNHVRDTYRVLLQMALVLQFSSGLPVVKLGRVAGQFAKPRSEGSETRDGVSLPSYRGDIINAEEFTEAARKPDPFRMVKAYNQSATTLNLLRAFATGGYSDLARLHSWNLDFCESAPTSAIYHEMASRIGDCLRFLEACGVDVSSNPAFKTTSFYTSHEALLLEYEEALTREDSTTGLWYGCSAHYLWLGERTRQLDGAHIEYLRGINNPLGVKISDKADPNEVLRLCDALNPENEPGRLTLVCRMGAKNLYEKYPAIVRAISRAGHKVVWQSDPMHGNTFKTDNGFKTRAVESIRDELIAFFDVHEAEGTHPGGIHLEMTGKDVTECVGGMQNLTSAELGLRYQTHCDPRLNASQSLELAFLVGDRMKNKKARAPSPPV